MIRRLRVFALLLLAALLVSGCARSGRVSSFERLLESCAAAAAKAVEGCLDSLPENTGAEIIDFAALQKTNPELYAWLSIPGTEISAPIAQNESGDIGFYQAHGPDGAENKRGCLYTHFRYSSRRFDEPVSVIYGKTISPSSEFSGLEELYRSKDGLLQHRDIVLFTETSILRYRVFCATEFSDALISREYNEFRTEADTAAFLKDIRSYHTLQRQTDDGVGVEPGDRLLVLTTKLSRDADKRFLVVAKLVDSTN